MFVYINSQSPTLDGRLPSTEVLEDLGFELTEFEESWLGEFELDYDLILAVELDASGEKYQTFVYSVFGRWRDPFPYGLQRYADEVINEIGKLMCDLSDDLGVEVEHVNSKEYGF